ncbi:MAG TPA: helix-turn-helix transcriptional regulator [Candidatus Baltobacteraceae bacterium]|nr:helix-turn-helix transcriptional regulator [Candidatus Baltobacteraceae bacterium]
MQPKSLRRRAALFGNPTRTAVLTALALLDQTHGRELARLTGASLSSVQAAVARLEREGAVATRRLGSERRIALNPRYFAHAELKELLFKLVDAQPELVAAIREARRRPRRVGKPL